MKKTLHSGETLTQWYDAQAGESYAFVGSEDSYVRKGDERREAIITFVEVDWPSRATYVIALQGRVYLKTSSLVDLYNSKPSAWMKV